MHEKPSTVMMPTGSSSWCYCLVLLQNAVIRHGWYCHAYCLTGNHYHLLIETSTPSLSKGMKFLNGTYTQYFNRQHQRVGHVFQGRFKAILVQKESYLFELARYIALNPVRAQMVHNAREWRWSSYRATAGLEESDPCLTTDWILTQFADSKDKAQECYREFVRAGKGQSPPWQRLKNQIFPGDSDFVEAMQCHLNPDQSLKDIPGEQKQSPVKPLTYFEEQYKNRDERLAHAYRSGHYTLTQIGEYFGVS
jgi:REP element-mobilizing transposase RayT